MPRKKNISNNFKGKEDIFWIKVKKGIKKFFEPAFNEILLGSPIQYRIFSILGIHYVNDACDVMQYFMEVTSNRE